MQLDPWLVKLVVVVVVVAWLGSLIASQVVKGYQPPEAINGAFVAIIGYVVTQQKKSGGGDDES